LPDDRKGTNNDTQRSDMMMREPSPAANPAQGMPASFVASENERTNDCEIIVYERGQRTYAEMIERNLKRVGLAVDVLFPTEGTSQHLLLANVTARGTLYALSVTPQHESKYVFRVDKNLIKLLGF
jgi:hypothetical protein